MIKRLIVSLSVFVLIIVFSFFSVNRIKTEKDRLTLQLDEIAEAGEAEDMETVYRLTEQLEEMWTESRRKLSFLVREEKLNALSEVITKIQPYGEEANDELEAEINNVRYQLNQIYLAEIPSWENIL
ncbi:MAG: DUF4363 family protein [Oscillospiraceae bacterium]|nr:DUF4363 family protein [Oscillospiraceae bacterium]